jgi:nitrogen regulatory protein P-II 1
LTGVFADAAWNGSVNGALFGNVGQLGIQAVSIVIVFAYSAAVTFVILKVVALVIPLRTDSKLENRGLDIVHHGEEGIFPWRGRHTRSRNGPGRRYQPGPRHQTCDGDNMKLIKAIIRPEKLADVLPALFQIDVRGLTVSRVRGHGGEREVEETYRGTTVKMELTDKTMIEIGVSEAFADRTVEAILRSARTGDVGDGKVFVLPVEKVYRIRTGEEDHAAVTPIKE